MKNHYVTSKITLSLRIILVLLISLPYILFTGCTASKMTIKDQSRAKRIIILGLDDFSVPGYNTAKHPHLDQLMENGVLSLTTRAVMPSVTLPNWTSHLTGSGPEQHGVDNNGWKLDNRVLPPVVKDNDGYYPSVFKILKDRIPNMKTAYYYNWGNLINPINKSYLDDINFQEDDRYRKNYQMAIDFAEKNQNNPTLIFLYSVHTDHAGHNHKWMSPEYIQSIEDADETIGDLINQLKTKNLYDDTYFFLITDHGGIEKGHGGMTPVEMNVPWAVTGPGIAKGKMLEEPNNNTNTSSVILRLFGIEQPNAWVGQVPESIFHQ